MRSRSSSLLLMPAAALAVHQARYSLAYGARANTELSAQGHSYLHSVVPWTIFALGVAATSLLRRVAHAVRTGDAGRATPLRFVPLWGATTVALLAVYVVQETLEGFVVSGHPGGLASSSFGHGGWWAVPVSALVALVVAALLRVARAAVRFAASLAHRSARRSNVGRPPAPALLVPAPVLARAAAGRAPPR